METKTKSNRNPAESRRKIVDAAVRLILKQGFPATTVDQICEAAGCTKGAFFYHFESKDAMGLAALDAWGSFGTNLYSAAWKEGDGDPLAEIYRLFDIMADFTRNEDEPCVCVVGMMSQEMSFVNADMRASCAGHLGDWTEMMRSRLAAAKELKKPTRDFDPEAVAWFLNSLWQGSMLIAKARNSPGMIRANLEIARATLDRLFTKP